LNSSAYYDRMDLVYAWLTHHKFPTPVQRALRRYFKDYLSGRSAVDEASIWGDLSPDLQKMIGDYMIHENVKANPLFDGMGLSSIVNLQSILKTFSIHAGHVVTTEGDVGNAMYIIEDGDCGVLKESKGKADQGDMHIMRPGQNFGMLGLLYGAPRAATVTAVKNCKTLSITYDELLRAIATCEKTCGKGLLKEMRTAVRTHLVRRIPTFKSVTDETIADLVKRLREVHYKRWQPIFMEGDQAKSILVLEEGVCIEHHGDVSELKEWRYRESAAEVEEHNNPGTFFGADCVTNSNAQNEFTLVAITECTVLDIPRDLIRSVLPATNGGSLTLSQQTRKIGS